MLAPLVGFMCSLLCSAALTVSGNPVPYTPYATHEVYFYGVPVGVYVDDTQPGDECQAVAIDRQHWSLVVAGIPPQDLRTRHCPGAVNALEWGQYWGHLPRASAYILESNNLAELSAVPPKMLAKALGYHPSMILLWKQP